MTERFGRHLRKAARAGALSLLAGALLLPGRGAAQEHKRLRAQVLQVYDGASFLISPGLRAALTGVSAPGERARGGVEAGVFLKQLIEGKAVTLELDEQLLDPSGQAQYYVFLEDNTFVNALVIIRGYGRAVLKHPNVRYRERLIEAENTAKASRRGIWGNEFPDPKEPFQPRPAPFSPPTPFPPFPPRYR
ncbi:MAG: thermonuclease family protein [Nitrospinota bacterium]